MSSLPLLDAPRAIFVDGRFQSKLSITAGFPFARFTDRPDFGTLTWPDREPMVALNTMLAEDGAVLQVPVGHDAGLLQLVSIATRNADFHPRHSIRLAQDLG